MVNLNDENVEDASILEVLEQHQQSSNGQHLSDDRTKEMMKHKVGCTMIHNMIDQNTSRSQNHHDIREGSMTRDRLEELPTLIVTDDVSASSEGATNHLNKPRGKKEAAVHVYPSGHRELDRNVRLNEERAARSYDQTNSSRSMIESTSFNLATDRATHNSNNNHEWAINSIPLAAEVDDSPIVSATPIIPFGRRKFILGLISSNLIILLVTVLIIVFIVYLPPKSKTDGNSNEQPKMNGNFSSQSDYAVLTNRTELLNAVDAFLQPQSSTTRQEVLSKLGTIDEWDVSNIDDFTLLFDVNRTNGSAVNFNADISRWNVSSAKTMKRMFAGAANFSGNLFKWDVSRVSDFVSSKNKKSKFFLKLYLYISFWT